MPREIRDAGFQRVRDYIEGDWTHIELRDETDDAVARIHTDDARCQWVHDDGAEVLELEVEINGDDDDIGGADGSGLPVTFEASALYDTAEGGDELSWDDFTEAHVSHENDTLIVTHELHIPLEDV